MISNPVDRDSREAVTRSAVCDLRIGAPAPKGSRATVLVGFAEALSAPEAVWSLVDAGFKVVAFTRRGKPSALRYSRHVTCHEICAPELSIEAASSDLRRLMVSLISSDSAPARILFPLDDKALFLCGKLEREDGWIFAAPQREGIDLALSKRLQLKAARSAGFNVPNTLVARTGKEIVHFSKTVCFPIFLKPAECVSINEGRAISLRTWICSSSGELDCAIAQWAERGPLIVQPFIAGTGEGIFGLSAHDGVRAWSAHRRVRMMNPRGSGSSACISQPVPEALKPKVEALVKAAGWRGIFMIELLCDKSGEAWFVELNGRPWGSMALARRLGLEYPAWQVELAMDQHSDAGILAAAKSGVVCRNPGRELMHVLFVLRGTATKPVRDWPSIWKTLWDVVRIRRGETLYNFRRDDLKVLFADCYYTLHDNLFKTGN
jgi:hypothetical protein